MSRISEFLGQHTGDDLAIDVETASDGTLIGLAMAYGPLLKHSVWFGIAEVIENKKEMERSFITHYGLYDAMTLLTNGIDIRISYDTYSAARILLWERREGFSLIGLAQEFLGMKWESVEELLSKKFLTGMEQLPLAKVVNKCRRDALATYSLATIFRKMVEPDSRREELIRIESELNHVLAHMRYEGFGFDATRMKYIKTDIKKSMGKLLVAMQRYIPDIQLNSNVTLVDQLFSRKGLRIKSEGMPMTPKTGRVSVSADTFDRYKDRHPILGMIAEWKRLDKLLNTYTDTYANAAKTDGRIHSKVDSFGAGTGRLSSSNPNMQNIPKVSHGIVIRKAFISRPGYTLVDIDYSQIQLVILAVFSKDENLMELFRSGQDMHRRVAAMLYDKPEVSVSDAERNSVKAVNFGMVFGGGRWLFEPWAGNDNDKQKEYQERWFSLFPGVKTYLDGFWKSEVLKRGFNQTYMGRRRPLQRLGNEASGSQKAGLIRLLVNGDIQGTEGDLLKMGMVAAFDNLYSPEAYIVMCVHDEIIFEVRDDVLKPTIARLSHVLETVKFPIALTVNVKFGKNWFSMKKC